MKKLLPNSYSSSAAKLAVSMKNLFTGKKLRFVLLSLFTFLLTVGINQHISAQTVYYLGSDGSLTSTGNDGIFKVNQDGTGLTRICNGVSAPQDMALDLPNKRAFVSSFSPTPNTTATANGIYRIDLQTGAATQIVATNNGFRAANLAYDPVNDYLYYTSNDGNGATTTAGDGINRIKGDGSGNTVLASSISPTPTYFGIDIPNNKIYIYESVTASPKILTYNLNGNSATYSSQVNSVVVKGMDYDPINNWIYYTTDNGNSSVTTDDALWKMRPNGTSLTKVIGNLTANPGIVTVERVNSVAFVWNSTAQDRRIVKVNVAAGTQSAFPITPAFAQSNQVAAIAIPAASKVATLASFSISSGTLSPTFASGTTTYTASVANSVTSITVTPTNTDSFATVKVNGTTVTSGSASSAIALNVGSNVISTVVTAEDGLTTQTYTLTVTRPKAAQTISFNALPTKTFGNLDFDPGALATSGLVPTYTSSNTSVATIVNGAIRIVSAGTSNITASQAGDANYLAATSVVQLLTVNKANQTITFNPLPAKVYGNADFSPGATVNSNLAISYSSSNTAVATIVNNQIHIVGPGTANITASQAGDANRNAATNVVQYFTVDKATVTVTANASNKVYGNNDPAFTYTATGVVGTDAPTGALSREDPTTNKFVGTYAINQGTLSYGNSYNITYVGADLTITKRPYNIAPVGATKVFGDPDPSFISFNSQPTTLAPGDATTGNFARSPGENVGSYATLIGAKRILNINTGVDVSSNYAINFISTNAFVITPKAIEVTANAASKSFGDADPVFTYSVPEGITDATFTGSLSRAAGEEIGTYALTKGSLQINNNYTFSFVSANLTIVPKNLIVTTNSATKVYGNVDPTYTFTTNVPIVGNSTFTGTPTRAEGKTIGTYAITGMGTVALDNPRYTLSFATGGALTITKRPITLRPQPATKSYGNADPTYPYQFLNGTSVAPGEGMSGPFGRAPGENVGTYALTLGSKSPVDVNTGVYTISNYEVTFISDNLTITPRRLDITANNLAKSFSDVDPELTYSINQTLMGSDAATGTLARATGETRGTYAINQGTLTFGNNYQIYYNAGTFTIGKKTIDVTANSLSKTYGTADPEAFTYTASTSPVGETFSGFLVRIAGDNVGTYPISKGSLALSDNYVVNFTGSDFTINKASLTYAANPISRPFKNANPAFSGTVTGFVNGETLETATTGTLVFSTSATNDSPIGSYAINGSGLTAANYSFTQDPANQTALSITASNDNTLSALSSSVGTLTPQFSPSDLNYNISVANEVKSIQLSATTNSEFATATLNGTSLSSGSSRTLPLIGGQNNFTIAVTAQDQSVKTYLVSVYRTPSANNTLSAISLSGITFTPAFSSGVEQYTASVPNSKESTTVYGVAVDSTATVTPSQAQPANVPLQVGENYVAVSAKAENGDIKNYIVTVTRAGSPDATLATIGNNTLMLNTPFVPATHTYYTSVSANTQDVTLRPEATNGFAKVKVNGIDRNPYSGNAVPLAFGNNNINISVTSQDSTNTINYVVNVIRKRYSDAALVNLRIPANGQINEEFNATRFDYTGTVQDSTFTGLPLEIWRSNQLATVKVNGVAVADPQNYFMSLQGGENKFKIEVTAQDSSATNTYNLVVTRAGQAPPAKSPNAALFSVNVNASGFSKNFNLANEPLEPFNVSNSVSSVNLFLYSQDAGATIKVNGDNVPGQNQEYSLNGIALVEGYNLLNVAVTAEDGIVTNTYKVEITRLPYVNVSLTSLALNKGTLSPTFVATTTTYNVTVPYSTQQLTLTPVAGLANATISVSGGTDVNASNPTSTVNLNSVGTTRIRLIVKAADGVNTKTYTLTVAKAKPANNALLNSFVTMPSSKLSLSDNGPASINYTTSVPAQTAAITLISKSVDPNAVIRVNGNIVASGVASEPIALTTASTVIDVLATAEDGITTKTYSLTVNKAGSSIVELNKFVLNPTAIFNLAATGPANVNYETTVAANVQDVTLTSTAVDPNSIIKVNGTVVGSGVASQPIALTTNTTLINVLVTAEDGITTKTYSVSVKKSGSSNANLDLLRLSPTTPITFTTVGSANENFTATVAANVNTVTLTAKSIEPNAVIKINGVTVASNTASGPISLVTGENTINVLVTAQNGVTTRTYSVKITKLANNIASLNNLVLDPGSYLTLMSNGSARINYSTSVSNTLTSVKLAPTSIDPNAVIRVNGTIVPSGSFTAPIALQGSSTQIAVLVTAEDGVTTNTYSITVNKTGSSNANLNLLRLTPSSPVNYVSGGNGNENHTATVAPSTTSVTLTPRAVDANAVIKVNGTIVSSNSASLPIALNTGSNTINVLVTAEDGVTTKTYTITVTRNSNATASTDTEVKTKPALIKETMDASAASILVHQGLSPNGDGNNDVLIIDGIDNYPDNKLHIMNRSGLTVFEAKGYNNGSTAFDGRANNGQLQTPGTYFYILEYKDNKITKRKTGYIVIKY
jgi:gliding motility-associated-like protein